MDEATREATEKIHIYTSHYGALAKMPPTMQGWVPISNSIPTDLPLLLRHRRYDPLVPEWSSVEAVKRGKIDWAVFAARYRAQLSRLDPFAVWTELHRRTQGQTPILLCYEADCAACHRSVAAAWLHQSLTQPLHPVRVEEWRPPKARRPKGPVQQSLF
jgi:hypothetical protein